MQVRPGADRGTTKTAEAERWVRASKLLASTVLTGHSLVPDHRHDGLMAIRPGLGQFHEARRARAAASRRGRRADSAGRSGSVDNVDDQPVGCARARPRPLSAGSVGVEPLSSMRRSALACPRSGSWVARSKIIAAANPKLNLYQADQNALVRTGAGEMTSSRVPPISRALLRARLRVGVAITS